ncbi:M14 family metallopeptidase [Joostella sp. CR20]|uniref:M14 family metallopeptidase n=1 Tax=Joostella sp. CR20 TaxID=2804312 RepID=UPI00313DA526
MKYRFFATLLLISLCTFAQNIQSPSEFLGYELGTNFTRHHRVVAYYKYLAEQLPNMVQLKSYGSTYEGRKLLVAFVSTAENIHNLEEIKQEHLKSLEGKSASEIALVWMSYNVHGNEAVSTEASMKTIYELLTTQKDWLKNTVLIFNPCMNPDGRDRYVNWYYNYKNTPFTVDKNSKEHNEPWLSGRPNHYMFDLNRDWAWVTQKESQQYVPLYNEWLPHIHVDFHEQSMDSPYYFAPASEPMHEVITKWQRNFQTEIGKNHASYFDNNGWLYFTKEEFDLLYPSYGDTYPIYNGAIGMTYEQGGSGRAGLAVKTANGDTLTLKNRIEHHFTTGISTVEMASKNAKKLNEELNDFYTEKNYEYNSYVLAGNVDKLSMLTKLLDVHKISYGFTSEKIKGFDYKSKKTATLDNNDQKLVISTNQPKSTLITVLFEPETMLTDSLTYDITAWSLPYAYGLDAVATKNIITTETDKLFVPAFTFEENSYAYVTDWNSMDDARFLTDLLQKNIRVRYTKEPFSINETQFKSGSLIVRNSDNSTVKNFSNTLKTIAEKHHKILTSTTTGFVNKGKDFGSGSVDLISKPTVALLSGGKVSTLNFGEVWHFFEQQLHYPVTVLDATYFSNIDIDAYDILILPETSSLKEEQLRKIKTWIKDGGKLIAIGKANKSLASDDDFSISLKEDEENDSISKPKSYALSARNYIQNLITGAIYKAKVDTTHPLAFGYTDTYYSMKLNGDAYNYLTTKNAVYLENTSAPLSGFAGVNAQKKQPNSVVFGTEKVGKGTVVYFVDNPLFRGFWENGKLFFVNALFMVE